MSVVFNYADLQTEVKKLDVKSQSLEENIALNNLQFALENCTIVNLLQGVEVRVENGIVNLTDPSLNSALKRALYGSPADVSKEHAQSVVNLRKILCYYPASLKTLPNGLEGLNTSVLRGVYETLYITHVCCKEFKNRPTQLKYLNDNYQKISEYIEQKLNPNASVGEEE